MPLSLLPVHHDRGPSTLPRIKACPGSYLKNKSVIEEDKETTDSIRGNFLHQVVVEVWNNNDTNYNNLSDGDQAAIDNCIRTLHSYDDLSGTWFFEDKLALVDPATGKILTHGTADAYKITDDDHAILIDWKMGFLRVDDPIENWQLSAYAAMIMQKYNVKAVESRIIQPFISYKPYTWTNEKQIITSIKNLYAASEKIDAPLRAGLHCTYCPSFKSCEVRDEYCNRAENTDLDDVSSDDAAEFKAALAMRKKQILAKEDSLKELCREYGGRFGSIGFRKQKGNIIVDLDRFLNSGQHRISLDTILPICSVKVGDSGSGESKVRGLAYLYADGLKSAGEVKSIAEGKKAFEALTGVNRGAEKEVFCVFKD